MAGYVDQSLAQGETVLMRGRWPLAVWLWAWLILVLLGIFVIGIVLFVMMVASMLTTEFAVTSQRVILKRGWIVRNTAELSVQSVEGVHLDQNLWERLWGYGRIYVTGTGEARIAFPPMADPVGFRRAIETARAQGHEPHVSDADLDRLIAEREARNKR